MDAHFGNAFADGFAIAKIAGDRAAQARQDSGFCLLVRKRRQPLIEV